ncbi:hypothetical protein QBC32DRAFT_376883 [Pseudoneurospora amorphoporcata]|uniref:Uncharacterized protein n=1 Tax=Pseudoneurospora amorphoporcata TaxID=241081 RepID=A0AAN6SE20_9PEZI|nr:hypothetical protein QBC32DRAFT_376883 [Pseudoneurospora amorphoporcata]
MDPDMMDIDDDDFFDDDELEAYFQAHGLDEAKWKGKGKAYGEGDVLGLDGSAGLVNPAGFGRGDVLGRDGRRDGRTGKVRAWLEKGDEDGDGDDKGEAVPLGKSGRPSRPGRPSKVLSPSPTPDPTLGSSPPVLSGLSIRSKNNNDITREVGNKTAASQTRAEGQTKENSQMKRNSQTRAEGQTKRDSQTKKDSQTKAEGEAALPDPYDSEASIAAPPSGVIRYVLVSEKFPEVWPVPEAEGEAEAAEEGEGQEGKEQKGKGQEVVEGKGQKGQGQEVVEGQEEENKGTHGQNVVEEVEGAVVKEAEQKGLEKEREKEKGANEIKGQTGKKEVVMPKGVVMLVREIQYLKMPLDSPSWSEVGSEYGYEGDSQRGNIAPSNLWSEEPRALGNKGGEKAHQEAYGNNSIDHTSNYSEHERPRDLDSEHSVERPSKELAHEIPETDLSSTSPPSTIADSNTDDYLPPPPSQVPPHSQSSLPSRKRTWSQRQDPDHPSSPSGPSPPSDPHPNQNDLFYHNRTPPPRQPSLSSSLPSQPPTGPPDLVIRLLLYDGEFWVQAILRPEFHHLVLGYDFDQWGSDTDAEDEHPKKEGGGEAGKGEGNEGGK